jgi:hypothetical protein
MGKTDITKVSAPNFLFAAALVALIGAAVIVSVFYGGQILHPATGSIASSTDTNTGLTTNNNCNTNTPIDIDESAIDAKATGTSVGGTWMSSSNGLAGPFNTYTNAPVNSKETFFLQNATTYHSGVTTEQTIGCISPFKVQLNLLANTTLTIKVKNPDTNSAMNQNGGASNATVTSGASLTMPLTLNAEDQKGTQKMRCVLETNATSKVSKMTLDGFGAVSGASVPQTYSPMATSSREWAFDVNSIEGAQSQAGDIFMSPMTQQTLAGSKFKITCYTYEYFKDSTTGAVVFGIEDSLGNIKSIATYNATYYIDASA